MKKNTVDSLQFSFEAVAKNMLSIVSDKPTNRVTICKSPLRYPGGKSKAVNTVLDLLPQGLDVLVSPFIGGGSIELAAASKLGIKVYGYDAFKPVVKFWQAVIEDSEMTAEKVRQYYPLSRTKFYTLQSRFFNMKDKVEVAAAFFVLNRASFSGTTLSGGMSPGHPRFTESSIGRLKNFNIDGLQVKYADFKDSMKKHKDDFLYLDPPYANGGNLYGSRGDHHIGFDHEGLAHLLCKRQRWILSYNDCSKIRELYKDYQMIEPKWTYGMSTNKQSKELLILSNDFTRVS